MREPSQSKGDWRIRGGILTGEADQRRTAILISGTGTTLQSLIDTAATDPSFPATPRLVFSNRPDAYGLVRASQAGVPTAVLSHRDFRSRPAFDEAVDEILEAHGIEFVCLAGFMRIFTPAMAQKWSGRMLNIHPALLPSFKGKDVHKMVLDTSVALTGASVHAVTEELDGGPIVAQAAVPRKADDDEETLSRRVKSVERLLYPLAVRSFLRDGEGDLPPLPRDPNYVFGLNPRVRYRP